MTNLALYYAVEGTVFMLGGVACLTYVVIDWIGYRYGKETTNGK